MSDVRTECAARMNIHCISHVQYMCLPLLKPSEDTCYAALSPLQLSPQPAKQLNTHEKQTVTGMALATGFCFFHSSYTEMSDDVIV